MNFIKKVWMLFLIGYCSSLFAATDPRPTRDIIIDTDITLTQCCRDIVVDFGGTFTELAAIFNKIEGLGCLRTSISQVDIGTTGFTINSPGDYQLVENVVFNPGVSAAAITINSDFVSLDLQCFSITQGNGTADVDGIAVNANFDSIVIQNGAIDSMSRAGINVGSGVSNIVIDSVSLSNNLLGLDFNGSQGLPISNYSISMVDLIANSTGASFTFAQRGSLINCVAQDNTSAGLEFISSFSNNVIACSLENTQAVVGSAYAISAITGGNNSFQNCTINGVSTNDTFSGNTATGIFIGATETADLILNNEISNCFTTSNAQPFGIQMAYTFTAVSNSGLPSLDFGGAALQGAEWSPNNYYIVVANIPGAAILKFTNKTLTQISPIISPVNIVENTAWSPDGSRVFGASTGDTVSVFDFNEQTLTQLATLASPADVQWLDWAPNGKYFSGGFSASLVLYNYSAGVITALDTLAVTNLNEVNFRYDSAYLATVNGTPANTVNVYNVQNLTLSLAASISSTAIGGLAWSPNGQFLATVGAGLLNVYRFTGTSLTLVTSISTPDVGTGLNVTWSPDGQYLGICGIGTPGVVKEVFYQFTQNNLVFVASFADADDGVRIRWSPNGQYVLVEINGSRIFILSGLVFPSNHIIAKNTISAVHGPALSAGQSGAASGRGLSASSGTNLIIENTAFDNDMNYVFVTNLYEQFLYNVRNPTVPSLIDNLSFPPL